MRLPPPSPSPPPPPPPPPPPLFPLTLCLAAAAALTPLSPALAHAATSSCAASGDRAFPLTTTIRGGLASYEPGEDRGTWYIDLTNTTRQTCTDVHPVVVLVDDKRTLKPSQPRLDFYDGSHAKPVHFESTDEQELVGVLDAAGFAGFTVAPGKTVTVKVRFSLTSDTASDRITANAAVIQRRGQDGDWIGESNDYRFGVGDDQDVQGSGDTGTTEEPNGSETSDSAQASDGTQIAGGAQASDGTRKADGTATGSTHTPSGTPSDTPSGTSSSDPSGRTSSAPAPDSPSNPTSTLPLAGDAQEAGERARELARTGAELARGLLMTAAVLLAVGGTALLLTRRYR
ncbi:hypothetical protein ACGFYV_16465 [Streptomyces sp. NPDC048297]|uniref:hypothetical protein n=1 Tax=Streptomyces sp. NPDC048297 TaxID=3365531 RepID=UPI00371CC377